MPELLESMVRYIGQTVTVFATCGGLSGSGFTGVLISADCEVVRLLTDMGAAPTCAVGCACTGPIGQCGYYGGCNPLGAIVTIPVSAIAAFTHNAI